MNHFDNERLSKLSEAAPVAKPEGCIVWGGAVAIVLFNTLFAILVVVTLAGIVFITKPTKVMHNIAPDLWLPLLIFMTPALVYSQFLAWSTVFSGRVPTGLAIASRQISIPWLLKPFVSTLWLFNFCAGCVIVISLSKPNPGQNLTAEEVAFIAALSFLLTFPANVYFLLAVKSFTSDDRILAAVWRYRIVLDLLLTAVAVIYYRLL